MNYWMEEFIRENEDECFKEYLKKEETKKVEIKKPKYWYKTEICSCVLCGRERKSRYRVYKEEEKGINWQEEACHEHFM